MKEKKDHLKNYFKEIRICKYCKREYGIDNHKETRKDTCPVCSSKLYVNSLGNEGTLYKHMQFMEKNKIALQNVSKEELQAFQSEYEVSYV